MVNEKRLIDPKDFLDLFYVASAGQDKAFIKAVEMVVEDTPTVDAEEVVRCEKCGRWKESYGGQGICERSNSEMWDDDFCSYGERKENG